VPGSRRPARLAASVALLALTACTGGETDRAAEQAPPADDIAARADEICTGTRIELQPARDEIFGRTPGAAQEPGDIQLSLERAAALLATEREELAGIPVPADAEGDVAAWLAEHEEATAAYARAAESEEAAAALAADADPLEVADASADALGFGACGTGRLPTDEQGTAVPGVDEEGEGPVADSP
jgi:hypothetical protein